MELTPEFQFLCFVSSKLNEKSFVDEIIKSTENLKIGEFVTNLFKDFINLTPIERISFFFSSPTGPTILSSIFNNTTNLQEPSDTRLLYRKGSWVNIRFAPYLYSKLTDENLVARSLEKLLELFTKMEDIKKATKNEKSKKGQYQAKKNKKSYNLKNKK